MKAVFRKIYSLLPFKHGVFNILKTFWNPTPKVYKHLHFHGIISVKIPKSDQEIKMHHFGYQLENELFWSGIESHPEKYSLNLWLKLCKQSNCIVDGGANTGLFSLLAKKVNPQAKVFAFEPVKRVFDRLEKNIALNKMEIQAFPLALSDYSGEGFYFDPGTPHVYSVTVNTNLHVPGLAAEKKPLQTIRLDDLVKQKADFVPTLIKLDVEGHESEVWKGYQEFLSKHLPDILMEVCFNNVTESLNAIFSKLPYIIFDIHEDNGLRQIREIRKSSGRNLFLCTSERAKSLNLPGYAH